MKVNLRENPKNWKGLAVQFPYSPADVEKIRGVLGLHWVKNLKAWVSEGPEVLLDMERLGIKIESMSSMAREIAEEFRQSLWDSNDCRALPIDEEWAYQLQGSRYLTLMPNSILGDDMGLGKTKQSIDASALVSAQNILVICDKTLCYNWEPELKKWHPEYSVGVVPDIKKNTKKKLGREGFWCDPPNMVIANYEKLNTADWPYELEWDAVILDEATRFKNSNTQVYKNVRRIVNNSKRAWALTGTPLEKKLQELYNILSILRPAVLGNFMRFKSQHLVTDWAGNIVGAKNLELLKERIAPFILRRTKAEVLSQLPPKLPPQNHFVKLSPEEEKAYEAFKGDFHNWLEEHGVSGKGNPLVEMLRMRQFCCTPAIFTDDLGKGSKFEALQEIISEHQGKMVVFCYFEEVVALLRQWLDIPAEAVISGKVPASERPGRIDAFNRSALGPVLLSTDAGQRGLNITGADLVVHYDQIFNAQKMKQREDRLHRIGQTLPVQVINLMCLDTIDYGIYLVNREEEQLFKDVIEGAEEYMLKKLDAPRLTKLIEGKI